MPWNPGSWRSSAGAPGRTGCLRNSQSPWTQARLARGRRRPRASPSVLGGRPGTAAGPKQRAVSWGRGTSEVALPRRSFPLRRYSDSRDATGLPDGRGGGEDTDGGEGESFPTERHTATCSAGTETPRLDDPDRQTPRGQRCFAQVKRGAYWAGCHGAGTRCLPPVAAGAMEGPRAPAPRQAEDSTAQGQPAHPFPLPAPANTFQRPAPGPLLIHFPNRHGPTELQRGARDKAEPGLRMCDEGGLEAPKPSQTLRPSVCVCAPVRTPVPS